MRPSEWLADIATDVVHLTIVYQELADATGLRYHADSEQLGSGFVGRHRSLVSAPHCTARELLLLSFAQRWDLVDWRGPDDPDKRYVLGYQVTEAVWMLLRPDIAMETPPSRHLRTPREKHEACLRDIRAWGH